MLCGLTGSGKTTYARRLERERRAVLLSADAWMIWLFGHHMPRELFEERGRSCKQIMLEITEQLIARGVEVVLDWGFWSRSERSETMERLRGAGAHAQLLWFDVSLDILWERLAARNAALPAGTFVITKAMLDEFSLRFEPPGDDEEPNRIDVTTQA